MRLTTHENAFVERDLSLFSGWSIGSEYRFFQDNVGYTIIATPLTFEIKATFHLTISMREQRATGKIQRNN